MLDVELNFSQKGKIKIQSLIPVYLCIIIFTLHMQNNLIAEKSFQFSLKAIALSRKLIERKEYILSKQFLKSATSIGANIQEATAAISKRDFTSKMSIASKEARESLYWLLLIKASRIVEYDYNGLILENESIINVLMAIVKTCQKSNS